MAEIKSAPELALERSRRYAISEEEREQIKEKELLQKATGLFNRFNDGYLSTNEVMREIERMDEKTSERVKAILLGQWADHLALDSSSQHFLDAFESLRGRSLNEIREKFGNLLTAYRNEIGKARRKLTLQLIEELRAEGIGGGAVEPNVEASVTWKGWVEKVNRSHQEKLSEIKNALKSL
jgi:hypothetical protein